MFDSLVESGRTLVARLERYQHSHIAEIPSEQRMASSEVDAWFDAAESVIQETFGKQSKEWVKWDQAQKDLTDIAREEIREHRWNEATAGIRRIHESMGLLTEFQIYWQAPGRVPPDAGRPPKRALYVFISYSQEDSQLADEIASDLKALGVEYFLDRKDILWGQSIGQRVRDGLVECSHQIILLSPASLKSQWVHFEVGYATGSGKVALPFLSHPSLDIPGYFADLLYKSNREDLREYFRALLNG